MRAVQEKTRANMWHGGALQKQIKIVEWENYHEADLTESAYVKGERGNLVLRPQA